MREAEAAGPQVRDQHGALLGFSRNGQGSLHGCVKKLTTIINRIRANSAAMTVRTFSK
jgi:hypothetical protein